MLTFEISTSGKEPVYEQIYTYIRSEIKADRLSCGMKLPSSRGLAQSLSVSRNTVDMAYGQLMSEGYIESRPRSGYYVSRIDGLMDITFREDRKSPPLKKKETEWVVDFSPNGVDMEYFPYNRWRKLMKEAMIEDNRELFQVGDSMGDLELRRAIRQYLHQSRGVSCDEEQILIGAGLDYLLLLLCQILGKRKKTAMEEATYKQAYRIFQHADYEILPVSMDQNGILISELEKTEADLVYVMPSHQFPTGNVMPISRRHQLLSWAMKKPGRYIIEDDYDSEFRYQGKPIPALQAADPTGTVIYAGTFSKAIAPAIRVGYLVLPWKLLEEFHEKAGFYSCSVSRIDQTVLEHFIKEGYFERHLNKMRGIYRTKQEFFIKELRRLPGDFEITGQSTGLHITLQFDPSVDEKTLALKAAEKGVKIYPYHDYLISDHADCTKVVLGFARLSEQEITKGVDLLKEAWNTVLKSSPSE